MSYYREPGKCINSIADYFQRENHNLDTKIQNNYIWIKNYSLLSIAESDN